MYFFIKSLMVGFYCIIKVYGDSSCSHSTEPLLSMCQGCPPMFEGLPCASTTWYNDLTKGSCGCGTEPNPPDYWTKSKVYKLRPNIFLLILFESTQQLGMQWWWILIILPIPGAQQTVANVTDYAPLEGLTMVSPLLQGNVLSYNWRIGVVMAMETRYA